ncbi:MAG TPA: GH25 family lysozyme [bacterium]|nr:GH25 family lysozyme [bacterium]
MRNARVLAAITLSLPLLFAAGCGGNVVVREGTAQAGGGEPNSFTSNAAPDPSYARGIDVSYYEGTIDWQTVKASGIDFAFIRVSDGTSYPDSKFSQNWTRAKDAGVIRGAYQFFRPEKSATAQANLLLTKMGPLEPGDLPPVLDVEVRDGVSKSAIRTGIATWVSTIENALGVTPIIYCSPGFWTPLGEGAQSTFLWVAHWGVSHPTVPSSWNDWTFWQYTDVGTVHGISGSGDVDLDVFHGTTSDLYDYVAGITGMPSSTPTPTPSPTSSPTPTPSPTATPTSTSDPALGVQVSDLDGTINWAQVYAAGADFAFVRVSYGEATDTNFATNWAGARNAGLVRGAYQLFRPNESASTQANLLLSQMGALQPGDLPPTLDVELTGGMSNASIRSAIATWLSIVEPAIGRAAIVRTSPGFWDNLGESAFTEPLYVVHWGVSDPGTDLPTSWSNWWFWEYTDSGTVSGIPGNTGGTSLNEFHGTLADLQAFAQ